jgi:hypothetical protein
MLSGILFDNPYLFLKIQLGHHSFMKPSHLQSGLADPLCSHRTLSIPFSGPLGHNQ